MRAKTHASGKPSNSAITVAITEVINESRSASDAGPLVTEPNMPDHATRFSSPTRGNNRKSRASNAPTHTNAGVSAPTRRPLVLMGVQIQNSSKFANLAETVRS